MMAVDELRRVLLVEDNADIRAIAQAALESIGGLEVRACESAAAALAAAGDFRPQVVLLDVMMPDMDGPGMLRRLREDPDMARVPVVFFTAKTTDSELKRLRGLGAADVITKPFDPLTLHEKVGAIWAAAAR